MKTSMLSMILCGLILVGCDNPSDTSPIVQVDRRLEELKTSPVPEEATHEVAAWAKLGVARVQTVGAPEGVEHRAALFDAAGEEVGSIEISGRRVVTRVAGHAVQIDLGAEGTFRVADLATGRVGETRFDSATKAFSVDPMFETLQAELGDIIPISMGTLSAIRMQQRSDEAEAAEPRPFDAGATTATQELWGCYGDWYRGGAAWGTRSGCCVIARQDAAQRCTNAYCFGCCMYRACDVWCSQGDYFCLCGISGRACG